MIFCNSVIIFVILWYSGVIFCDCVIFACDFCDFKKGVRRWSHWLPLVYLHVLILPSLITKQGVPLQKFLFIVGRFSIVCANAKHEAWNSLSHTVINLHETVGRNNVFSKHSSKKSRKDQHITAARIRTYTARLTTNYNCLPTFATVSCTFTSVTLLS